MNTIVLDTHKTISNLVARGYSQQMAEGFVDALSETDLVTRDVLDDRLKDFRIEIYKAMLIQTGVIVGMLTGIMALFFSQFGGA